KQDTTYTFVQSLGSGVYGISSVADANNRAETFTWTSGYITAVTSSTSGRALHLTWSKPANATAEHVAGVYTDPVTGTSSSNDLTWTYNYTGDQLGSACPPTSTTACTAYTYTAGSHYQTAVLDAGAQSYWRLGESATAAATAPTTLVAGVTTSTALPICLDDTGSATADGTKIQIWQCLGDAAQKWTLTTSGGAVTWGGKCLDVASAGTANGALVVLNTCSSGASQQWTWGSSGSVVNVNSGKCLDDPTSSTTNGTQLQIYTCNASAAQNWGHQVSAASAVTANEGNDTATYSGATLGAAGPLTGSAATAATFDGVRSNVSVPNALVTGAGYLSVSLWFKTSSSGPLWCEQSAAVYTASPSNATCSLYVGTDGKLRGAWFQGATAGLASSVTVNNGAWHHAVLSGAGTTQSLYLDGGLVGTLSGTINNLTQTYGYIGAGWSSGVWPDTTTSAKDWYFSGSIAEVAFYAKALMASDVAGLYKSGTYSASLMTKITRPSGKVHATVSYDAVSARATGVVDENGGSWTINTPTVVGTSLAYRAAVLGSQPTGYYRLGDTAGATSAYDEVNYGKATYSNVTLGGAGPFGDTTSAAFDGSSSYLTLPSTDQVSTGPNTVEMWFKMN
ncbi:MAG TPA: ricin-type beta-trefoil lectin domain protein, partial [Pseudonocardiaceae bacterium]